MKKQNVYLLGNPLIEQDSLPVRLLPKLKISFPNINFQIIDPTENFSEEEHLVIIDTIVNANKVSILTEKDFDKIQSLPNYSLHDFDLGMQLKLMKKLGKLKRVMIIGVPSDGDENEIVEEIVEKIKFIQSSK